jgi:CheY-like chemotaxis protein
MRGTVSVESKPGQGSTFTIHLPAELAVESDDPHRIQPPADFPVASQATQQDRGTVLVIDDDPVVRDLMSRSLAKLGFRVVTGKTGAEALELAKKVHPLLITLDVMMPEVDGWSVLKQLKADPATAETPVIMITIVDNEPMGIGLGASGYLVKPVDRDRLAVLVERCTSRPPSKGNKALPELLVHS